ncbi:MAG: hypothetical protein JJU09_00725 [Rhodobacteraceae bacterium]|nr:hypothetical protein [Paracoccaceae bacterium]TVR49033.1 MAG: hypothetical protein EA386_02920 [Paracoccaceae bacterium]
MTCASALAALERQDLGSVTVEIDGILTELEVFEGPVDMFHRSLAGYRTNFGGDGGMISIEGMPAQAVPGAHPMQGMAAIQLEFDAPAPLDADSPADEAGMFYVMEWGAGARDPARIFASTGPLDLRLTALDLTEGAAHIAGVAIGMMCPHDMETEQTEPISDSCFEMSFQFDTALLPFAPPVRIEPGADQAPAAEAPAADGPATMDVLGRVNATLGGEEREWLTIAGDIRGQQGASANFQRMVLSVPGFSDTFGAISDELSEEEREQLGMLDDLFGGDNPMAGMLEQLTGEPVGGTEHITLTISGHDPASPNILTEQTLALDVYLYSDEPPLGQPMQADITYVLEASGSFIPAVFYTSSDGGGEASVIFERLDLGAEDGHATGTFQGNLCRMEGARLMDGPDLSDCLPVEGRFDTALQEEEPYRP